MEGNRKFRLCWFNYVQVFFFSFNTVWGQEVYDQREVAMMPLGIQALSASHIGFYSQIFHLMISKWLLRHQHYITSKFQAERIRQEEQGMAKYNIQTETLSLKKLSEMPDSVIFACTSLASIVLHGHPSVREAKCITTMSKIWVLLKGREDQILEATSSFYKSDISNNKRLYLHFYITFISMNKIYPLEMQRGERRAFFFQNVGEAI